MNQKSENSYLTYIQSYKFFSERFKIDAARFKVSFEADQVFDKTFDSVELGYWFFFWDKIWAFLSQKLDFQENLWSFYTSKKTLKAGIPERENSKNVFLKRFVTEL